ncbi:hypothetical protein ACFVU3_11535 [Streptomyces sp. NPDC058052]|uniref:hypothetical protein n=1 Tax=Streptomyces sp. NPDC058052 TaxID=3346316 RepID=UPI0036EC7959
MSVSTASARTADGVRLRIWGLDTELHGFTEREVAEVEETFAGSVAPADDAGPASADLILRRGTTASPERSGRRRSRHRGGSSARKFFLDGTPYRAEEQHRDITVVSETPGLDVYAEGPARVEVRGNTVTVSCDGPVPPMLLADIVEDRLLSRVRAVPAVQIHCAAWLRDGRASLITGDSGAGKTTTLFSAMRDGGVFLSNDRAFLRMHEGRLEVRSFPLPVNVGCGTIRSLGLDLPDHGLSDHDKIRLRPAEVAERFAADCEGWYPLDRVLVRDPAELDRNIYWDEDDCHPFWVRSWHPGPLPAEFRAALSEAVRAIAVTAPASVPR